MDMTTKLLPEQAELVYLNNIQRKLLLWYKPVYYIATNVISAPEYQI